MVNKSYQKIISTSLEKFIWFFLLGTLLSPLSRIVILMFEINYILKVERDESRFRRISIDPSQMIFLIAISLVIVILWALIKKNIKQQNKSSSIFLHSLFKVMLLVNVLTMIQFINNIIGEYQSDWKIGYQRFFLWILPDFAWRLLIITFLIIVIRSYSKIISYSTLLVFRIIGFIIVIINVIINIINLVECFNTDYLFRNDWVFYFSLEHIISIVISILMCIIWILWINKFVIVYDVFASSNEDLIEKEESPTFIVNQRNLNNSLRKYGIISIIAGAMILRLAVMIYQFIRLFNNQQAIMNTKETIKTLLTLLTHPSMIPILIEVIIYLWIAILVLFSSKKYTLTPFITLFILYCHTLFQSIIMYVYLHVRYIDYSSIVSQYNTLYIQFIPLLGFIVFIGILIWRYSKLIKPKIVKIVCTGFVITLIAPLIFSIIDPNNTNIDMALNLISLPDTKISIIVMLILNAVILVFWVLFSIFYCRELILDNDNDSDGECELTKSEMCC